MNNFMLNAMAHDAVRRGRNIAKDPFASASFFRFIVQTTVETLFGVKASRCRIESTLGIFGFVSG